MPTLLQSLSRWRRRQKQVLICGPSGAGKTSLLASLQLAADIGTVSSWPGGVRLFPATNRRGVPPAKPGGVDDATAGVNVSRRWHEARTTIREGRLPVKATAEITSYAFDLEMDHYDFWAAVLHGQRLNVRYRLVDGPGGSLLPKGLVTGDEDLVMQGAFRSQLIEKARESESLVLCVDGNDDSQSSAFFGGLSDLLSEMRGTGEPYLRFESIVIVLTKADEFFERYGTSAANLAARADPWSRAVELLTDSGMANLLDQTNPSDTELLCGWASAYGFSADGAPNFDQQRNRMRSWEPNIREQDVIKSWRPFQILDAFVYLSVGELGGLRALHR